MPSESVNPRAVAELLLKGQQIDAEDESIASLFSLLMQQQQKSRGISQKELMKRITEEVHVQLAKRQPPKPDGMPNCISIRANSCFSDSESEDANQSSSSGPGYTLLSDPKTPSRAPSFDSSIRSADVRSLSSGEQDQGWGSMDILDTLDGVCKNKKRSKKQVILNQQDDLETVLADMSGAFGLKKTKPPSKKSELLDVSSQFTQPRSSKVQFASITIREYQLILGDNPSSKAGPSLSIGWEYSELPSVPVKVFEKLRKPARSGCARDLIRSTANRERLARRLGYSWEAIANNVRSLNKDRSQRRQTLNSNAITSISTSSALVKAIFKGRKYQE